MHATAAGWRGPDGQDATERGAAPLGGIARTMCVVIGLAGGAAVFVIGGFLAAVTGCLDNGETTAFCPGSADVATALEILALVPGVLAPIAGGIASCVSGRGRWLPGGLAVGALMFAVVWVLATGQQGLLS